MRIREYRQTDTSPLKYIIELSESEMSELKSSDDKKVVNVIKDILDNTNNIEKRT